MIIPPEAVKSNFESRLAQYFSVYHYERSSYWSSKVLGTMEQTGQPLEAMNNNISMNNIDTTLHVPTELHVGFLGAVGPGGVGEGPFEEGIAGDGWCGGRLGQRKQAAHKILS